MQDGPPGEKKREREGLVLSFPAVDPSTWVTPEGYSKHHENIRKWLRLLCNEKTAQGHRETALSFGSLVDAWGAGRGTREVANK